MAKKHECPEPPKRTDGWMGTYGDMVTLLMAFFVMLFAMSTTDANKFQALLAGLAVPFGNTAALPISAPGASGGQDVINTFGGEEQEDGKSEFDTNGNQDSVLAKSKELLEGQQSVLDGEQTATEQIQEVEREVEEKVKEALDNLEFDGKTADIRDDARGLVIDLGADDVLFNTGSAQLTQKGISLIQQIAPVLINSPNTIVVEGHTDNQQYAGDGYDNWNLAGDRAVAVLKTLVGTGLPASRVSATSYGESRPLVPNNTPEGRAENRRVEILVVKLDQLVTPEVPNANPQQVEDITPQDIAPRIEPNIAPPPANQ